MSKYLIVSAHPEAKSFNHAMVNAAVEHLTALGHEVQHTDLYAMQFQPVPGRYDTTTIADPDFFKLQREQTFASDHDGFAPDVQAEIDKLFWCDVLVLQFPLWWFSLPAILKGWVDRVMVAGRIYGHGKWYDTGAFRGKKAMLSLSTGSPESQFGGQGVHLPMETVLAPIHHGILRFNGFEVLEPMISWQAAHLTQSQREDLIRQFTHRLAAIEPPAAASR